MRQIFFVNVYFFIIYQKLYSANNWIATLTSFNIKETKSIKSYIPRIIELRRCWSGLHFFSIRYQKLYSANNWIATVLSNLFTQYNLHQKLYSANNWIATIHVIRPKFKYPLYQKLYSANNWIATKTWGWRSKHKSIKSYIPRIIELRHHRWANRKIGIYSKSKVIFRE